MFSGSLEAKGALPEIHHDTPVTDVIVLPHESQQAQEAQEAQDLDEVVEALNQPASDLDGFFAGVEAGEEEEDEAEHVVQEQQIIEAIAEGAFEIDDAETFVEALSDLSTPVETFVEALSDLSTPTNATDEGVVSCESDDITVPACIEGESEHEWGRFNPVSLGVPVFSFGLLGLCSCVGHVLTLFV